MTDIIPAILTRDRSDLERKLRIIETIASSVHLDVADGRFVANTTLPLAEMAAEPTRLAREFHLMVTNPIAILAGLKLDSASRVAMHVECFPDQPNVELKRLIKQLGQRLSLTINPGTPLDQWLAVFNAMGRVMVMGVEPGFQGHDFVPTTPDRVHELRRLFPDLEITVDGGVGPANVAGLVAASADRLVVGSALWQTPDPAQVYRQLVAKIK